MSEEKQNSGENQNSLTSLVEQLAVSEGYKQLSGTSTSRLNNRYNLITLDRTTLSYMYNEHGIVQTLVEQPVLDAFRNGIEIYSSQLKPADIQELQAYLERERILDTIKDAICWARLFGGGGIVVNTIGKADQPIPYEQIGENTPLAFYDADRWELNYKYTSTSGNQITENNEEMEAPYFYYEMRLNKDRVLPVSGKKAPSIIRRQLGGWGASVVERAIRSINQYLKNNNLIFELLDEAKIDVYKIENFNNALLNSDGTEQVQKRVQSANMIKNYLNALTMDINDDYQQKQMSFGGLAEILTEIRKGVAADLKMPMTKLFGISSAGFNSGEDDIENYNSMVESEIRTPSKYIIIKVLELCCKKLFGFYPDDLQCEFPPLRMLSAEQEENVKNNQQKRQLELYDRGLITPKELKQGHNAKNLIDDINLKENDDVMEIE